MKNVQRIIKYLAIAFAISIIASIVSSIMFGVLTLGNIFDNEQGSVDRLNALNLNAEAKVLNIDVDSADISILIGDTFSVETNSKYINSKQEGNQLTISEEDHNWFFDHDDNDIYIYVPEDYVFDAVSIHSKAGKIKADTLAAKNMFLDLGVGKSVIKTLNASESIAIDGGAGSFTIKNGEMHNLKMDLGVGNLSIHSKIYGKSSVDCGVGAVDITLVGSSEDYQIKASKGIGRININDLKEMNGYYGNGANQLEIDGGIGSIEVQFTK